MADKIQIRRGLHDALPTLSAGELGYCTDSKELFVGTVDGNVKLADNAAIVEACQLAADVAQLELDVIELNTKKLTALPAAAQKDLAADADAATIAAAFNALLAAMKSSGLMNT